MSPPAKLVKIRVLEEAVARIQAIDPDTDSLYYDDFDFVAVAEPPPEQYLRHSGNEVPSGVRRMAFVWHDDDPRRPRDSGRNEGTLSLVVTAMQRYEWADAWPFGAKQGGFKSRAEVRAEMESDLIRAFADIRLGGTSVFAEHVDTRPLQIATTYDSERRWVECELMFDVVYKYLRAKPWLTSSV
jgi:hypothetical protein